MIIIFPAEVVLCLTLSSKVLLKLYSQMLKTHHILFILDILFIFSLEFVYIWKYYGVVDDDKYIPNSFLDVWD